MSVPPTAEVSAELEAAQKGIADLMSQVADADAMIVDLRDNNGGSPETVALVASYVFDDKPIHLVDVYESNKTTSSWTHPKVAEASAHRHEGLCAVMDGPLKS